uniref:Uncharacterized protein n=1 Tax=Acartia pacifica TaxID=335913 RepID=A0A0U2UFJ4_ACAPC|nr:hypothetical protein [Acartia pacifica]
MEINESVENDVSSGKRPVMSSNSLAAHCLHLLNSNARRPTPIRIAKPPILAAVLPEGQLLVVTTKSIDKVTAGSSGPSHSLYSCLHPDKCIRQGALTANLETLYLLVTSSTSSQSFVLRIPVQTGEDSRLFTTEENILWILPVTVKDLRESVILKLNAEVEDIGPEDEGVVVSLERRMVLILSTHASKVLPLEETGSSKAAFVLHNIRLQGDQSSVHNLTDLINTISIQKKLSGLICDDEVLDIQVTQKTIIILLRSGELWSYGKNGKQLVMNQVKSMVVGHSGLTVVLNDLRIFKGTFQDIEKRGRNYNVNDTLGFMKQHARISAGIETELQEERIKLDQLRIFSKLREGIDLFHVSMRYECDTGVSLVARPFSQVWVELRLAQSHFTIQPNFFILKLCLRTRKDCRQRLVPLNSQRGRDSVQIEELSLAGVQPSDFPLILTIHVLLLESSVLKDRQGFMCSENIFHQKLSPFLLMVPRVRVGPSAARDKAEHYSLPGDQGLPTDDSDRGRFIRCLAQSDSSLSSNQFETIVEIPTHKITSHADRRFDLKSFDILLGDDEKVVYSLLNKSIEFVLERTDNLRQVREWKVRGDKEVVLVVTSFLAACRDQTH